MNAVSCTRCCDDADRVSMVPSNAGRPTPSVACIVQPGSNGGFQKLFFGKEEIAIPVYGR